MSSCNRCGNHNGKITITGGESEEVLCSDCFNKLISSEVGVSLMEQPEPISVIDAYGTTRIFAIEKRIFPFGISIEAEEEISYGYKFAVLGDLDCNQELLFRKLVEKVKRGVGNTYIKEETMPSGHMLPTMVNDRIVGRIDYNEKSGDTPMLVIDGKPYTWEEFGKIMMSNEGFQFRLNIIDITDDAE